MMRTAFDMFVALYCCPAPQQAWCSNAQHRHASYAKGICHSQYTEHIVLPSRLLCNCALLPCTLPGVLAVFTPFEHLLRGLVLEDCTSSLKCCSLNGTDALSVSCNCACCCCWCWGSSDACCCRWGCCCCCWVLPLVLAKKPCVV